VGNITFGPVGRGRGAIRPFGRRSAATQVPENAREINEAALTELGAMEGVRAVYPSVRVPVEVKYGSDTEFNLAAGVPMAVKGEGAFQSLVHGRFFASDTEPACMLSLDYAKRMNEKAPASLVGQDVTLNYATSAGGVIQRADMTCSIVGIVERETGPFAGGGGVSPLMIPMGKAKEMFMSLPVNPQGLARDAARTSRPYQSAVVRAKSAQSTQEVQDRIKKMGFSAFSLNDALQGAKRGFLILDIVLALIGSIALAVSSLGIMNTMVMSILERTREIGIMKAIGGSDGDIRRIFLIEASAIGFFGGVAGVMLGWLVGRIINFGANMYIQQQGGTTGNLFTLPFWLIGGAIGFSIAISLIAGSYPAARAAKLDPIQALRHD
jgi:predicted lysophospholipase L1 biosynthesis ABC-type transport system permease subunit